MIRAQGRKIWNTPQKHSAFQEYLVAIHTTVNPAQELKTTPDYSIVPKIKVKRNVSYKIPFLRLPRYFMFSSTVLDTNSIQPQRVEVCIPIVLSILSLHQELRSMAVDYQESLLHHLPSFFTTFLSGAATACPCRDRKAHIQDVFHWVF